MRKSSIGNRNLRKTKIVSTIGPASSSEEMIEKLIKAGVNVFRQNFSHGSYDEHEVLYNRIRNVSKKLQKPIAILQDLSGPKIRITEIENDDMPVLQSNSEIELAQSHTKKSSIKRLYISAINPCDILSKGNMVLLADGIIELKVTKVAKNFVTCTVVRGGNLRSRIGIAFPDSELELPATTEKDMKDLAWGIEKGVDYVALSFVQTSDDVKKVKDFITSKKSNIKVISKIEFKKALKNIENILNVSDGIMVARGDLGLEIPMECVPIVQKELIAKANTLGKPVIVATQMLHSMVNSIRPTRAESTDVANAILDGADAVMLSEETAIGNNPIEAVNFLDRVALEVEPHFRSDAYFLEQHSSTEEKIQDAIAFSACAAADKLVAEALVICSDTGRMAQLVSKYRPSQIILGVTATALTYRQMNLLFGVHPIFIDEIEEGTSVPISNAIDKVKNFVNFKKGNLAVCTMASPSSNVSFKGATALQVVKF